MIQPRAVAVQGLGSSPMLRARQGLWPAQLPPMTFGAAGSTPRKRSRQARRREEDALLFLL